MMDDLISRQAAIKALEDAGMTNYLATGDFYGIINALTVIKNLPTAEKRGEWVAFANEGGELDLRCSVCGEEQGFFFGYFNYCPHCGARMEEEENG